MINWSPITDEQKNDEWFLVGRVGANIFLYTVEIARFAKPTRYRRKRAWVDIRDILLLKEPTHYAVVKPPED